jgi:hypothetical protein
MRRLRPRAPPHGACAPRAACACVPCVRGGACADASVSSRSAAPTSRLSHAALRRVAAAAGPEDKARSAALTRPHLHALRRCRVLTHAAPPAQQESAPPPPAAEAPKAAGQKEDQSVAVVTGIVSLVLGVRR